MTSSSSVTRLSHESAVRFCAVFDGVTKNKRLRKFFRRFREDDIAIKMKQISNFLFIKNHKYSNSKKHFPEF